MKQILEDYEVEKKRQEDQRKKQEQEQKRNREQEEKRKREQEEQRIREQEEKIEQEEKRKKDPKYLFMNSSELKNMLASEPKEADERAIAKWRSLGPLSVDFYI